jgi:hypothetical protein
MGQSGVVAALPQALSGGMEEARYSPFFLALGGNSPFRRRYIADCE